ncbi:hypothetical protein KY363_00500 [Candidatus Woesearchaeota archaeon]|nr:hypothetical protein [Candidatus Woesearchaeota archaeon]
MSKTIDRVVAALELQGRDYERTDSAERSEISFQTKRFSYALIFDERGELDRGRLGGGGFRKRYDGEMRFTDIPTMCHYQSLLKMLGLQTDERLC